MNNSSQLSCRYSLHNDQQISGFCPYPNCSHYRLFCIDCLLEYHSDHAIECKKLSDYHKWIETFSQKNFENLNKLDSIFDMIKMFKSFKEWYESQYNLQNYPEILNIQNFNKNINNLVHIQQITNIIDYSIKPQIEKLKNYLEYIMNSNTNMQQLITYDEFIQALQQNTSNLINRNQKNHDEAKTLYWAAKYEDCIQKCDAFQRFNFIDVRFLLLKADCYIELKDFETAIENYKIAIDIDQENVYAYGKIGDIHQNRGMFQEAINCYDQCISLNSELIEYQFKKAKIYQKQNQLKACLECLDKVLSKFSSHIEALQMKATILQLMNEKQEAFDEFKQQLKNSGEHVKTFLRSQLILRYENINPSIIGSILNEDEVEKKFQKAYKNLEKNPEKTLLICKGILNKDKTNFNFLVMSAYAMKNQKKYAEALEICELVKHVDPLNKEIEVLQSIIYTLIQ